MNTPNTSRAFTVGKTDSGWARKIVDMPIDQLGDGDVLIQVEYSGINFKDGLALAQLYLGMLKTILYLEKQPQFLVLILLKKMVIYIFLSLIIKNKI